MSTFTPASLAGRQSGCPIPQGLEISGVDDLRGGGVESLHTGPWHHREEHVQHGQLGARAPGQAIARSSAWPEICEKSIGQRIRPTVIGLLWPVEHPDARIPLVPRARLRPRQPVLSGLANRCPWRRRAAGSILALSAGRSRNRLISAASNVCCATSASVLVPFARSCAASRWSSSTRARTCAFCAAAASPEIRSTRTRSDAR